MLAVCGAILFLSQLTLAVLPNIEVTSLLILLYTLTFGRKTLLIIYLFVLLEGLIYGFQLWWVMYLYVWTILWLGVTLLARRERTALQWAIFNGVYGLLFGGLCALSYLPVSGAVGAFGWWIAGIPMDLLHGVGNFVLTLTLFAPLRRVLSRAKQFV